MITAEDVLKALAENLERIRSALGSDWPLFYRELAPLREGFTDVADRNALEIAADPVWQVCRRYPFVKDLIHKHTTQRKPPAGGTDHTIEMPVREIVNRFQSLFDKLEEMDQLEEGRDQPREDTSQSGAKDANDHRTHP